MERTPASWEEAIGRLALAVASRPAAEEWTRQAIEAWAGRALHELADQERALAFQRYTLALHQIEDAGELAFEPDHRTVVAGAFRRTMNVWIEGPPWRLGPAENRPTYDEWAARADFTTP